MQWYYLEKLGNKELAAKYGGLFGIFWIYFKVDWEMQEKYLNFYKVSTKCKIFWKLWDLKMIGE